MLALSIDPDLGEGDFSSAQGALATGLDLQTLVIASLFCDAPAQDGDPVPDGQPRSGWWADAFSEDGDVWGSRLWLLKRAKLTSETCRKAEAYAAEALRWMISDGVASKIVPVAEIAKTPAGRAVVLYVDVFAPHERTATRFGPWDVLRGVA